MSDSSGLKQKWSDVEVSIITVPWVKPEERLVLGAGRYVVVRKKVVEVLPELHEYYTDQVTNCLQHYIEGDLDDTSGLVEKLHLWGRLDNLQIMTLLDYCKGMMERFRWPIA